jgi:hypothetical protein
MPNPRGYRPGSRGMRPDAPNKRSPFDIKPAKKPFKRFKSAFEAFDPLGQQDARVIDVDDHAVRVVGLKPPSDDPTGILAAMDEAIMEEIKELAKAEIEDEQKEQSPRAAPKTRL